MLPFHRQVLVGPGHVDVAGFEIAAVLADHRHAEREAAPHGLGHRLLDRLLGGARFGPEALQQLAAMFDLDERPGPIVAASPEGHELLARLQRPLGSGHQVRDLDGKRLGLGGQDIQRQQGDDLLAKAVLRLELGAIGPGVELRRPRGVARGVGREPLLGDDFAQFPGVGIRGVGRGPAFVRRSRPVRPRRLPARRCRRTTGGGPAAGRGCRAGRPFPAA